MQVSLAANRLISNPQAKLDAKTINCVLRSQKSTNKICLSVQTSWPLQFLINLIDCRAHCHALFFINRGGHTPTSRYSQIKHEVMKTLVLYAVVKMN